MKIEGNVTNGLTIADLDVGDVFRARVGFGGTKSFCYYMKTDSEDDDGNGVKVNAVNLENGMLVWIDENDEIQRVNGKFVIE